MFKFIKTHSDWLKLEEKTINEMETLLEKLSKDASYSDVHNEINQMINCLRRIREFKQKIIDAGKPNSGVSKEKEEKYAKKLRDITRLIHDNFEKFNLEHEKIKKENKKLNIKSSIREKELEKIFMEKSNNLKNFSKRDLKFIYNHYQINIFDSKSRFIESFIIKEDKSQIIGRHRGLDSIPSFVERKQLSIKIKKNIAKINNIGTNFVKVKVNSIYQDLDKELSIPISVGYIDIFILSDIFCHAFRIKIKGVGLQ